MSPFPLSSGAGGGVAGTAWTIATSEKGYGEVDSERVSDWAALFSDGGNIAVKEQVMDHAQNSHTYYSLCADKKTIISFSAD